jgi:ABC-2 type transport system ATP-binding protein
MNAVIETNDLGKQYGRKWALRDCTLSIPEGKVVGSLGRTGQARRPC